MPPKLKPHHSPALLAALTAAGAALALAGGAAWRDWPPAAFWHLVFAVGAMPMVFAAMTYFTPVLTRTPEAPRSLVAMSREVADSCLQYWGGMGFTADNPISQSYRDGRLISIGGGADEIMLGIICKLEGTLPGKQG